MCVWSYIQLDLVPIHEQLNIYFYCNLSLLHISMLFVACCVMQLLFIARSRNNQIKVQ